MAKVMLDTNMILRYVLKDNDVMLEQAKIYLKQGNIWVTLEIIAEVVYVLKGLYGMNREQIFDVIMGFMRLVQCEEKIILYLALETYKENNLDFVDCVLYAYNKMDGFEIATFDKKLLRLLNGQKVSDDEQT